MWTFVLILHFISYYLFANFLVCSKSIPVRILKSVNPSRMKREMKDELYTLNSANTDLAALL